MMAIVAMKLLTNWQIEALLASLKNVLFFNNAVMI